MHAHARAHTLTCAHAHVRTRSHVGSLRKPIRHLPELDADGSGEISTGELIEGMRRNGLALTDAQMTGLHHDCDMNHDGQLTLLDFTSSLRIMYEEYEEEYGAEEETRRQVQAMEAPSDSEDEEEGEGEKEEEEEEHWQKVCAWIKGERGRGAPRASNWKAYLSP